MSMALWMYFWTEADWVQPVAAAPDRIFSDIAKFAWLVSNMEARLQPALINQALYATIKDESSEF